MPTLITAAVETTVNTTYQNLYTVGTTTTTPAVQPQNVQITGNAGTFSSDSFASYQLDDTVTLSGTLGGNTTITGYVDPTTYYIVDTDGSTTFQLSATQGGANIVTTSGPTTGLTFTAAGTAFPALAGTVTLGTVATPQTVTYSALQTNVGNTIAANTTSGVFTLSGAANTVYQLSGSATVTTTPAQLGWVNTATGAAIGPVVPAGTPLSTTYLKVTANAETVGMRVSSLSGQPFAYPTQIQNATATVTEISGYTVP